MAREQKIKTVFVEGAVGNLDARYLRFTENKELNRKIADRLAKLGELTGADLYLLHHAEGVDFTGIENPELYRKDIEYFTFEPFPSLTIIRKKV